MSYVHIWEVSKDDALNFFYEGITHQEAAQEMRADEAKYVASILAHHSITSRAATESVPPLADLGEVFETLLSKEAIVKDEDLLENTGSQLLFFTGFLRDQMRRRYNVNRYERLGQSCYDSVSDISRDYKRVDLFGRLSQTFPTWALICRNLHYELAGNDPRIIH